MADDYKKVQEEYEKMMETMFSGKSSEESRRFNSAAAGSDDAAHGYGSGHERSDGRGCGE